MQWPSVLNEVQTVAVCSKYNLHIDVLTLSEFRDAVP